MHSSSALGVVFLGLAACAGASGGHLGDAGTEDARRSGSSGSDAQVAMHDAGRAEDAASPKDAASDVPPSAVRDGATDAATVSDAAEDSAIAANDALADAMSAPSDAGGACEVSGAPGTCVLTSTCAAEGDHTSYPGHCPGAADIECCIVTPSTANNPPTPAGYVLMMQSQVTPAMTTWAVMILNDPTDYPMFSTTTMTFGTVFVLGRVEWHPPDFQNSVVHRGVTLYTPSPS